MSFKFNPFTGSFDLAPDAGGDVPDPLTVDNLTVNQILTADHIHGNIAGSLYVHVKNTSGSIIPKRTPVYVVGSVGDTTVLEVAPANRDISTSMPAIGITNEELAINASGHVVIFGEITSVNTASFAINDELYVASGGGLTNVRPSSGITQSVAIVGRVHSTTGTILVKPGSENPIAGTSNSGLQLPTGYGTVPYASTVTLNFAALNGQINTISLTGPLTFVSSNLANGLETRLRLVCDSTTRNLTFPINWKFVGTKPPNISASKVAILSLASFGSSDTDVVAAFAVQL